MSPNEPKIPLSRSYQNPGNLRDRVKLTLLEYSESSFTDPHTVVCFDEPAFDEDAYSHIGKVYEGVEPHRMGGHGVVRNQTDPIDCTHHFDPNYRDSFIVALEHRTELETLCISTRFFAGNPASDLTITLFDDVLAEERTIVVSNLAPDSEHWLDAIHFHTTRIALHFKAGGITRIWAYGDKANLQPEKLTWLSMDSKVLFKEDDFFGGPNFALSQQADRTNEHMLGWETSRSAMGLRAVFPITSGTVQEIMLDTYRHVNNYLRSAWIFRADLPPGVSPRIEDCPCWEVTSSEGQIERTHDLKAFFRDRHAGKDTLPTYSIAPQAREFWQLETTFCLNQDAMHVQSRLAFRATHICIMLLPHGGLHAIKIMGTPD